MLFLIYALLQTSHAGFGSILSDVCNTNADCASDQECLVSGRLGTCVSAPPKLPDDRKNSEVFNLPSYLMPGMPSITCKNYSATVALQDSVLVDMSTFDNDVFELIVPTGETLFVYIEEKDLWEKTVIPGSFTFTCDAVGVFTLKFKIIATDMLQSVQDAMNYCSAQFICTDGEIPAQVASPQGISAGDMRFTMEPVEPMLRGGSPTPPPASPGYSDLNAVFEPPTLTCLAPQLEAKIGSIASIPLDTIYTLENGTSSVGVKVVDRLTSRRISGALDVPCPETAMVVESGVAVGVASFEHRYLDVWSCPLVVDCVKNRPPVIGCASVVLPGTVGEVTKFNEKDVVSYISDPDGDDLRYALTSRLGEIMFSLEHTCVKPGPEKEDVRVVAFDGEEESSEVCQVTIDCVE